MKDGGVTQGQPHQVYMCSFLRAYVRLAPLSSLPLLFPAAVVFSRLIIHDRVQSDMFFEVLSGGEAGLLGEEGEGRRTAAASP